MGPIHRQRGYTQLSKLFLVALVAAAAYFAITFWPAARSHYRIKNDAKRLANRLLTKDGSDMEHHIEKFLKVLYEREGLVLTRAEVSVDNSDRDLVEISVRVELPYEYPFLEEERLWQTTIEVYAERARGF